MNFKVLFLAPLFGALLFDTARAEISLPPTALPEPVAQDVTVPHGESVVIRLRVHGKWDEPIRFRIRSGPLLGTLSEPSPISKEEALVTYQSSGDPVHLHDSFTYAAQTSRGVSGSVTVNIEVLEAPPILAVQDEVDFGEVLLGATNERFFAAQNKGGGVVEGVVETDPPWSIKGNAAYHLGHGESQAFTISCSPDAIRDYIGEVRYSSHPDRITSLKASAKPPFSVSPGALELSQANDATRSGKIQVINHASQPVTLSLHPADTRLNVPQTLEIPGGGTGAVEVRAGSADDSEIEEPLTISDPGYTLSIPIHARSIGPILKASEETVNFGMVRGNSSFTRNLTVENAGGAPANVNVRIASPFHIRDEDSSFTLEPRASRSVTVTLDPVADGSYRGLLSVSGGDSDLEVPVEAAVSGVSGISAMSFGSVLASSSGDKPLPAGLLPQDWPILNSMKLEIRSVQKTAATLEWKAPEGGSFHYEVQWRKFSLDEKKKLKTEWLPLQNVAFTVSGNRVEAALKSLKPEYLYAVRISATSSARETPLLSNMVRFQTAPGFHFHVTRLKVLLFFLAVLIAFVIRDRVLMRRALA